MYQGVNGMSRFRRARESETDAQENSVLIAYSAFLGHREAGCRPHCHREKGQVRSRPRTATTTTRKARSRQEKKECAALARLSSNRSASIRGGTKVRKTRG